jgi:hemoglobin-like flavoprotein
MYEQAKDSLGRCLNHGGLISRFYALFVQQHPDIAEKFTHTDMSKQESLLMNGINLSIMFAEDNPIGLNGIQRIRKSHCRDGLDIRPEFFPIWLESFIQALAETDRHFGPVVEKEWREILQKTIDYITDGYDCQ